MNPYRLQSTLNSPNTATAVSSTLESSPLAPLNELTNLDIMQGLEVVNKHYRSKPNFPIRPFFSNFLGITLNGADFLMVLM